MKTAIYLLSKLKSRWDSLLNEERLFVNRDKYTGYLLSFIGVSSHTAFLFLFYFLHVDIMFYFNFLSIALFTFCSYLVSKEHYLICYILFITDVVIHQSLCVRIVGWDAGFQYYIIGIILIPLVIRNISRLAKTILTILILSSFVLLDLFWKNTIPLVHVDQTYLLIVNSLNICTALVAMTWTPAFFVWLTGRYESALIRETEAAVVANRAKSDFVANMSHEVRTPMNAIIGLTHLMQQTALNVKQQDYVEKIQYSATALLGLLNDILDFSKVEAGKLDLECIEFNLDEVIKNTANIHGLKCHSKGIDLLFSISREIPPVLKGDPLRLCQVLNNLISNAIKFTSEGHIIVSCEIASRVNEEITLQFSVSDTGVGISQEQQPHIFDAFTQADSSTTRKYGGTGLGLAICASLVELMQGHMQVESETGLGSTFTFTAVFSSAGRKETRDNLLTDIEGRILKALVINQSPLENDILTDMLESLNIEVSDKPFPSHEPYTLAHVLASEGADLVFIDCTDTSAKDVAVALSFHSRDAGKPEIVVILPYESSNMIIELEKAGIRHYLHKPLRRSQLFDTVTRAMLPLEEKLEDAENTSRPQHSLAEGRVPVILLVEDNDINQQVAREILQMAGFQVDWADNGSLALDKLQENRYDAVLMDVNMPVMDGYETTMKIRNDLKMNRLPIIALTAEAMLGAREASLNAGMNDYVTKPINPDEVIATLSKWLDWTVIPATENRYAQFRDSADEAELPPIPGISYSEGMRNLKGNRQLYRKLLIQFRNSNLHTARSLEETMASGDVPTARRLVHTVKGVTSNLGITGVYAAARSLESAIANQDAKQIPPLLDAFNQEITRVVHGIAVLCEANTSTINKAGEIFPADAEILKPLLVDLAKMLDSGQSEAVAQTDTLIAMLKDTEVHADLLKMKSYIDIFDFESALTCLKAISQNFMVSLEEE